MQHLSDLNYGYVKIVSGTAAGRIGRYTCDDRETDRAKVYFGYQSDVLSFPNYRNYIKLSHQSLTNDITKKDLIDRYYNLLHELDAIDLNTNPDIKKHSAEHTNLITECNLVRGLLRARFRPAGQVGERIGNGVMLLFSPLDIVWANDFSLGLSEKGFQVMWDDHEDWTGDKEDTLYEWAKRYPVFILVASKNSARRPWLKMEYRCLCSAVRETSGKVFAAAIDDAGKKLRFENVFDLSGQFSDAYYQAFDALIEAISE